MICLRGGLIAEAMCSGANSSGKNIEALQVSKNGVYNATGDVDGYSPVTVAVADRYDEGYQDGYQNGYSDAQKVYENLYKHEKGTLPSVTDEQGNVIDNAIIADNDEELNNYICNTDFSYDGDNVTINGLNGDTSFTIKYKRTLDELGNWRNKMYVTLTNKITGVTGDVGGWYTIIGENVTARVTAVTFMDNYSRVAIGIEYTKDDGTKIYDTINQSYAMNVGGTRFINSNSRWAYS